MSQLGGTKAHAARTGERAALVAPLRLPRRMTATDALFWYAESALPILRPIIAGLYVLDRVPDAKRLEQGLQAALVLAPRLRQRVVETPLHVGLPEWIDDVPSTRSAFTRRGTIKTRPRALAVTRRR
jgi:hypothetical protein